MHTYRVTGIILVCLRSRWTAGGIRVEIKAANREAAMKAALATHKEAAEQQDPEATVIWHTSEPVQVERLAALEWQA